MLKSITRLALKLTFKPFIHPRFPVGFQRTWIAAIAASNRPPKGTVAATHKIAGIDCEVITNTHTDSNPERTVLYLHGGGYVIGNPKVYRPLNGHLAKSLGSTNYVPDYRLAPEHPFPAALDDAVSVWQALLDSGVDAQQTVFIGDSAGGGLTMATVMALRDRKLPLPKAIVLLSPWVDLTLSGDTISSNAKIDPMLSTAWINSGAEAYCADQPRNTPGCSPLFGDLSGLPPTLIQVGSDEILLSDSTRLADSVKATRGDVTLQVFEGLWHDFQNHAGLLGDSDQAIADIERFVSRKCVD